MADARRHPEEDPGFLKCFGPQREHQFPEDPHYGGLRTGMLTACATAERIAISGIAGQWNWESHQTWLPHKYAMFTVAAARVDDHQDTTSTVPSWIVIVVSRPAGFLQLHGLHQLTVPTIWLSDHPSPAHHEPYAERTQPNTGGIEIALYLVRQPALAKVHQGPN